MNKEGVSELLSSRTFLTFGGGETYLYFVQRFPLREFCAFEVIDDDAAWQRMEDELLRPIADAAAARGLGLLTDCMVWRASPDYVTRLGHGARGVAGINDRAVHRMREFVERWHGGDEAARSTPVILAADLGPRGDGYSLGAGGPVPVGAAHDYHAPQVTALAEAGAELLVALTMTSVNETLGILRAAEQLDLPVLVSPTIETDGTVPDGTTLGDFITTVDDVTGGQPVGYIANCAHPSHLEPTLRVSAGRNAGWLGRFLGLRANASAKSHAELDDATELDRGSPAELARQMADLRTKYGFTVLGGCCGTDAEHLRRIADLC